MKKQDKELENLSNNLEKTVKEIMPKEAVLKFASLGKSELNIKIKNGEVEKQEIEVRCNKENLIVMILALEAVIKQMKNIAGNKYDEYKDSNIFGSRAIDVEELLKKVQRNDD